MMSLPLSLEIVATDISQDYNGSSRMMLGVVGEATINANCSEHGGLMVGGAGWRYMSRGLPDPLLVESYDLGPPFFPPTTETSLVPSSDTPCGLPNWYELLQPGIKWMSTRLGLGLWFNDLRPPDELQQS